ncbi:TPA: hypothetical protein DDW35_13735, partial [Candidatus Sumerlaeota bacterium]|nr:hypothetical protein [Candidatus Sumerlaeota bacterium]
RKWNPFEVAFEVAARRGLEILISYSPYLVVGKNNNPAKNPILRRFPKWAAAQHPKRSRRVELEDGSPDPTHYFCPVNREARRFLGDVLHAVLAEYPFHGLLLDLRDYPFYTIGEKEHMAPWCYCAACRGEEALRDLGFDPASVNFANEHGMVERWREWQAQQMDEALEYIRARSLKARSNLRVLGLLPSDSRNAENKRHPLIHWKTWGERSLVEALILDGYPPHAEPFETQLEKDLATLPENLLLLPMLSCRNRSSGNFHDVLNEHPIPGFVMRFDDWMNETFDPSERIAFDTAAFPVESDPLRSVCAIFRDLQDLASSEQEFAAFLGDLSYTVLREDMELSLPRLMMVSENIKGLLERVQEGHLNFGEHQDQVIHDLDLAHRLTYLAFCDLKG